MIASEEAAMRDVAAQAVSGWLWRYVRETAGRVPGQYGQWQHGVG